MIEVVLDGHKDNVFLNVERPVYDEIECFSGVTLSDYRQEARKLIAKFSTTPVVIIKERSNFSVNMLALAMFIESCLIPNEMDCLVFKVENYTAAVEAYKPFVAVTIAIKYALRLIQEKNPALIYREFMVLNYLNFDIKEDYVNDKIIITLPGDAPLQKLTTNTPEAAIAVVSSLKALSLAKAKVNIELEIAKTLTPFPVDQEKVIERFIEVITPFICLH
jgi:hypothetical protein